jgi:hypothetical protein
VSARRQATTGTVRHAQVSLRARFVPSLCRFSPFLKFEVRLIFEFSRCGLSLQRKLQHEI